MLGRTSPAGAGNTVHDRRCSLSPSTHTTLPGRSTSKVSRAASATVTIANKLGLHARPAMIFVEKASDFQAEIAVRRCDQNEAVDGKSIMQMMMLAATAGTRIEITATGADAKVAIRDLVALVKSKFEED